MSEDPQAIASFKAALARSKTEDIVKKLDDNTIARQWKRDLAEAEVARRTQDARAQSGRRAANTSRHHAAAIAKGWIITAILIAAVVLVGVAYVMG